MYRNKFKEISHSIIKSYLTFNTKRIKVSIYKYIICIMYYYIHYIYIIYIIYIYIYIHANVPSEQGVSKLG